MKEIELMKIHLEQERRINPLKPHWLLKDEMQPCEAVLVYYKIEPSIEQLKSRDMQLIKAVDHLGIYDVLMSSKFRLKFAHTIDFVDFVHWTINKGFDVPEHLKHFQNGDEASEPKDEDLSEEGVSGLSSVKFPLLLAEISKRLMKEVSKQEKFRDSPANEIIKQSQDFKSLRVVVRALRGGKDYGDEWYQRKTSSVGPRKRK